MTTDPLKTAREALESLRPFLTIAYTAPPQAVKDGGRYQLVPSDALANALSALSATPSPVKPRCYCPPGQCMAPSIMGRPPICLDPDGTRTAAEAAPAALEEKPDLLRALYDAATELDGLIDEQTYEFKRKADFNPHPDDVWCVSLTARQWETMDQAILAAQRQFATLTATPPVKMLVDADWLKRKTEADPDLPVEAATPPAAQTSEPAGEAVRAALEFYANEWWQHPNCKTTQPNSELYKDRGERARQALAALSRGEPWSCMARKQPNGPDTPADCDWPVCGCDPAASKVIEALEEAGALKTNHQGDAGVPSREAIARAMIKAGLERYGEGREEPTDREVEASYVYADAIRALYATPTTHQPEALEHCLACLKPFKVGDRYYLDASGGEIHADCCGPEREGYTGPDGEPLGPNDPIPEPAIWTGTVGGSDHG